MVCTALKSTKNRAARSAAYGPAIWRISINCGNARHPQDGFDWRVKPIPVSNRFRWYNQMQDLKTFSLRTWNKLCAWRHNMPPPLSSARRAPPSRRNVAVLSHAEYVPTLTDVAALRVKAALNKAAWWPWPLTFWPWKWCPSRVWGGLHLCQFWSS